MSFGLGQCRKSFVLENAIVRRCVCSSSLAMCATLSVCRPSASIPSPVLLHRLDAPLWKASCAQQSGSTAQWLLLPAAPDLWEYPESRCVSHHLQLLQLVHLHHPTMRVWLHCSWGKGSPPAGRICTVRCFCLHAVKPTRSQCTEHRR